MNEPSNHFSVNHGTTEIPGRPVASSKWFFALLFAAALGHYLWAVSVGWNNTITDRHAFRQTQTAITTAYMVHQPLKLAYETPVLGAPWAVPMEFPLYQWIVAGIVDASGLGLESAGRLVSVSFYLLMLIPVYFVLGSLRVAPVNRLAVLAAILASPFYTYWSRTFLIETCGLFFAMAYLAFALESKRRWCLVLACVFGVLAALVKVTTFIPFGALAGLYLAREFLQPPGRWPALARWFRPLATAFLATALPMACAVAWTHYADHLKEQNVVGHFITSKALTAWNFGTWNQKTSWETWKTLFTRAADVSCRPRVFWCGAVLSLAMWPFFRHRWREVAGAVALFLLAPALFTNLQYHHDYYMCANGVFLIGAIAFVLLGIVEHQKSRRLGLALFATLVVFGFIHEKDSLPFQRTTENAYLPLASQIRAATPPEAVNIYIGLDWNPAVPYYSGRRALMIPDWKFTTNDLKLAFQNLKGQKPGLLVVSSPNQWSEELITNLMKEAGLPEPVVIHDNVGH